MTPQEVNASNIIIFKDFVSKVGISRETIIEGWQHYRLFTSFRKDMNPNKEGILSPEELSSIAADKRFAILSGEKITLTPTEESADPALFAGDTLGTSLMGGQLGILLEGLRDEELEKGKRFCQAMNKVGLRPGDIGMLFIESQ